MRWLDTILIVVWIYVCLSLAGRTYFVNGYAAGQLIDSPFEPLAAGMFGWCVALACGGIWFYLNRNAASDLIGQETRLFKLPQLLLLTAVGLPAVLIASRCLVPQVPVSYFEVLWFAIISGAAVAVRVQRSEHSHRSDLSQRIAVVITATLFIAFLIDWYRVSDRYHSDFLLGFNDFGHFLQRIANTSAGRGFLLETPVLPTFWDHFNPGLTLLVPLWKLWPSPRMIFVVQALALSLPAVAIHGICRVYGGTRLSAVLWAAAWLFQPVVSQANLAFTYGWHPISLAIAPMLLSFWAILRQRFLWAACLCVVALSMEEGVIVVYACGAVALALQSVWRRLPLLKQSADATSYFGESPWFWLSLAIGFSILFVIVFRLSGLAEFQTGRFQALGSNVWEIASSPITRPKQFWGQIFRPTKAAFLLSLAAPIFIPGLWRGWRIAIACCLPLLVLIIWDHTPATCIAFQYTSALLPVLWLASISGAARTNQLTMSGSGALATGVILSLFIGQLPYSLDSMIDVKLRTYRFDQASSPSVDVPIETAWQQRSAGSPAGQWLHAQLAIIRADNGAALATSRIAAHLVGNEDVETVGQFLERREQLSQLPDRRGAPLQAYRWIVLDRREAFQQSPQQTAEIETVARQMNFEVVEDRFDIVILKKADG